MDIEDEHNVVLLISVDEHNVVLLSSCLSDIWSHTISNINITESSLVCVLIVLMKKWYILSTKPTVFPHAGIASWAVCDGIGHPGSKFMTASSTEMTPKFREKCLCSMSWKSWNEIWSPQWTMCLFSEQCVCSVNNVFNLFCLEVPMWTVIMTWRCRSGNGW